MVKRILALSLLMVGLVACGGQEDSAGEQEDSAGEIMTPASGGLVVCDETPCWVDQLAECRPNFCINQDTGHRTCQCRIW